MAKTHTSYKKDELLAYLHCKECGGKRKGIIDSDSFLKY